MTALCCLTNWPNWKASKITALYCGSLQEWSVPPILKNEHIYIMSTTFPFSNGNLNILISGLIWTGGKQYLHLQKWPLFQNNWKNMGMGGNLPKDLCVTWGQHRRPCYRVLTTLGVLWAGLAVAKVHYGHGSLVPPVKHQHHQDVPQLMTGTKVIQLPWKIALRNFGDIENKGCCSYQIHDQNAR